MWLKLRVGIMCGIAVGFLIYTLLFSAPFSFPDKLLVHIERGSTGQDIAHQLKEQGAVRSEFVFRILLRLYGDHMRIIAGTYYFPSAQNAFAIAWRLRIGNFDIVPVRVTVPEGTNVKQMSELLGREIAGFDQSAFLKLAVPQEGYLFPDTYFFYPGEDAEDIVKTLRENFDTHIADANVQRALHASGKPLSSIVIMASLLEKEAPDTLNRQKIADILWKRLSINMPLQVDAVFPYITGKDGDHITQSDYSIDSPYNTYKYKGLPPGPITNPGVDAIVAATHASSTSYLYYLSGKDGNFYYSATYEGQLANQKKYR